MVGGHNKDRIEVLFLFEQFSEVSVSRASFVSPFVLLLSIVLIHHSSADFPAPGGAVCLALGPAPLRVIPALLIRIADRDKLQGRPFYPAGQLAQPLSPRHD